MEIEGKFFGHYLGTDDRLDAFGALAKTVGKFVNYIGKNTDAKITDVNYIDTGEEHMGLGFCLLLDVKGNFETIKQHLGCAFKFGEAREGAETCGGADTKYANKKKSYFVISKSMVAGNAADYPPYPKFGNFELNSVSLKLFENGHIQNTS